MSSHVSNIKKAIDKTRLEEGLKFHEEAYVRAGISIEDDLLQEILYRRFWEVSFHLLNVDPQEIIQEYRKKSSKLWKILHD